MEIWPPQIECPSVTNKDKLDFSNKTINDKLTYRADQGKWGLQLSYGDYEIFHACNVNAFIPDTITHLVRPCVPVIKVMIHLFLHDLSLIPYTELIKLLYLHNFLEH
jgi:hypothetical protein